MTIRYESLAFKSSQTSHQAAYERVVAAAGLRRAERLWAQIGGLERLLRAAAGRGDTHAFGRIADRWLRAHVAEVNDPLRRATVAALAVRGAAPHVLPPCISILDPDTHGRLSRFLEGPHAYDEGRFAGDLALALGASASVGALTVVIPPITGFPAHRTARRLSSLTSKALVQGGVSSAWSVLAGLGFGPLAELHVDTRTLRDFNQDGFIRCYHRLAALMEQRPDIAGIYGASWLYDPKLAEVSPSLAFVRRTAEAGGGAFLRLRTEPIQIAYAVARSPARRRLHEAGGYDPVCYGMYWPRRSLIDWSWRHKDAPPDEPTDTPAPRHRKAGVYVTNLLQ